MNRLSALATAALALAAALVCAIAALLAHHLGLAPAAGAGLVGVVALVVAGVASVAVARTGRARQLHRERMRALAEMLESSGSEDESRALLLDHVGRLLPQAGSAMLIRSDADDRLEPAFGERVAETPLRGLLVGHPRPQACLAIRLGHAHVRGAGDEALVGCELCGRLSGESVCEPLQASGRMLGSLIVASVDPIAPGARERLRDATTLAAPRLALQRVLATADHHAALDGLTGLPNRRAADETLARLAAQAGRTVTSLAAVLVDLDHFAAVNERFGHELGDGALARIGRTLAAGVRASDFVARYGGQAFLVLAPDTGRSGAADLAEKLRCEIEQLAPEGIGLVTASLGVAALPEDAVTPGALIRRAERALGMAKALGRNRVATPEPSPASEG